MTRAEGARRRDDRGAVAIIAAISAVVLFGIGAMAVDLGNAFARARDVQASADFSALAGGQDLPGPTTNTSANSTSQAVIDVANYLNRNQPLNESLGSCQQASPMPDCVQPSDLVDGNYANGEVVFSDGGYKMTVYTPSALVKFGLANVIGFKGADLSRSATVGVYSPAKALPFYVGDACSWGTQQVVDPPPGNGSGPSNNPTLTPASANYNVKNLAIDPTAIYAAAPTDTTMPSVTIYIDSSVDPLQFDKVGFSLDGGSSTTSVALTAIKNDPSGLYWEPDTSTGDWAYTLSLPSSIATVPNYYYVRLHNSNGWSHSFAVLEIDNASLTVSSSTCAGTNDGNFGALDLSRDDATNTNTTLAMNTIMGLEHSIGVHPDPGDALNDSPQCKDGVHGSVWPTNPPPDPAGTVVDCVQTDPGNPQTATQGLVTGITDSNGVFHKGLLDASNPGAGTTCDVNGGKTNRTMPSIPSVDVNDDVLTCFFLPDATSQSTTVGQISDPNYSGPQVISSKIFESPRFVYLPVLSDDPNRGSKYWPIIGFRAAFITGQDGNASPTYPESTLVNNTNNGLVWQKQKKQGLAELHLVLINNNALPPTAVVPGNVIRYIGSGTKVIRLIN